MSLMLMFAIKAKSLAQFLPCYYFLTLLYQDYWINYILQKPRQRLYRMLPAKRMMLYCWPMQK